MIREPISRRLKRVIVLLAAFGLLCSLLGVPSIMYVFNVHGGLLPLKFAPFGFGLEAVLAALVSIRIAFSSVPRHVMRRNIV